MKLVGRQMDRIPRRGDIWFADLGDHPGTSVQGGCRPVIIVSNDIGNERAETINVLPMTRHLKRSDLPCHTELTPENLDDRQQVFDPSMILAEQISLLAPFECLCGNFILPEPASYVFFYAVFNLRKLLHTPLCKISSIGEIEQRFRLN